MYVKIQNVILELPAKNGVSFNHMDLVSEDVNGTYSHLGGTSESKKQENGQEYVQDTSCKLK